MGLLAIDQYRKLCLPILGIQMLYRFPKIDKEDVTQHHSQVLVVFQLLDCKFPNILAVLVGKCKKSIVKSPDLVIVPSQY